MDGIESTKPVDTSERNVIPWGFEVRNSNQILSEFHENPRVLGWSEERKGMYAAGDRGLGKYVCIKFPLFHVK